MKKEIKEGKEEATKIRMKKEKKKILREEIVMFSHKFLKPG